MNQSNNMIECTADCSEADRSRAWLSSFMDGHCAGPDGPRLVSTAHLSGDDLDAWVKYHLIGDAMRGSSNLVPDRSPVDFLSGVMAGIQPGLLSVNNDQQVVRTSTASNDSVFRWKALASVATLVAVVATGWGTLHYQDHLESSGLQAAQVKPEPIAADSLVRVGTPVGTVLRDPRLESLLAEHRQQGGMSALQMPAGFLRSATQVADESR